MSKKNVLKLVRKIVRESKDTKDYHTGLLHEHIIVSAYKSMTLKKLESLRYILNELIKERKEYIRIQKAKKEK